MTLNNNQNDTDKDERKERLRLWQGEWKFLRDILLFVGGIMGIAHETLLQPTPDPTLLIVFGAMMGLPAFLRSDEK